MLNNFFYLSKVERNKLLMVKHKSICMFFFEVITKVCGVGGFDTPSGINVEFQFPTI